MPEGGKAVPRALERELLFESGYRCAIPVCQQTPVELAHIKPWGEVSDHTFDNMIARCPNCHRRYDRGEIERAALRRYEMNLSVLNGRYSQIERRALEHFREAPPGEVLFLPGGMELLMMNLLRDGLVTKDPKIESDASGLTRGGQRILWFVSGYVLTDTGREYIDQWLEGDDLNV